MNKNQAVRITASTTYMPILLSAFTDISKSRSSVSRIYLEVKFWSSFVRRATDGAKKAVLQLLQYSCYHELSSMGYHRGECSNCLPSCVFVPGGLPRDCNVGLTTSEDEKQIGSKHNRRLAYVPSSSLPQDHRSWGGNLGEPTMNWRVRYISVGSPMFDICRYYFE